MEPSNFGAVIRLSDKLRQCVEYSGNELSNTLPIEGDDVGLSRYELAIKSVTNMKEGYIQQVDDCFAKGEISQRERDSLINEANSGGKGFQSIIWGIRMTRLNHIGCLAVMEEDRVYGMR